jgi:hypothetical protein
VGRVRQQGPDGVACEIRRVGIGSDLTSMFRSAQREGSRVWAAVEQLLRQPAMIAAEVLQQQETAGERRAALLQEIEVIEAGLAKRDREAQRRASVLSLAP